VAETSSETGGELPEPTHRTAALELVWRCRDPPREACPNCSAPPEEFVLVAED
jgi:rubrerythrin